jgi:hypothetical protein
MSERRRGGRKERVLHTRISEQLSDDIRQLAEDLRVPTSNLVRNVLEEVFTVVETVTDDVGELFEDVLEEADAARGRIRRRHRHQSRHARHNARQDSSQNAREGADEGSGSRARQRSGSRRGGRSWSDIAESEVNRDEKAEAPPRPRPEFPEVIGWQPLVLNQTQDCADCGRFLPRGSRAFVGLTEKGLSRSTLCRDCIQDR